MQVYSENDERTSLDREERVRLAGMLRGPEAVMDLPRVREAISRAERTKPGKDGRRLQIGPNVAEMVVRQLCYVGAGELPDGSIHKVEREWTDEDSSLTSKKVRLARRRGVEEGLWEERPGIRPNDGVRTVLYLLNLWRVAEVVVGSELAHIEKKLERERRLERQRPRPERAGVRRTLEEEIDRLRKAQDDLALGFAGGWNGANPEPEVHRVPKRRTPAKKAPLQDRRSTSVVSDKSEPPSVADEDRRVGSLMEKIKDRMLEAGYRLSKGELSFNRDAVRELLAKDAPTDDELEGLPEGCVEFFEWNSTLDAAKALRRMRQQERRSARIANGEADGTPQRQGSPDHVVEAFLADSNAYVRRIAHKVGQLWDWRKQTEEPPWKVLKEVSPDQQERERIVRRLRRLARDAEEGAA